MKKVKRRNYHKIGALMYEYEVDFECLAEAIGRSVSCVSSRFSGESWWTMAEMYAISDYFLTLTEGEMDISKNFDMYFPHPSTIDNSREMVRKLRKGA